jgi:PAS domain S-box-containing protein
MSSTAGLAEGGTRWSAPFHDEDAPDSDREPSSTEPGRVHQETPGYKQTLFALLFLGAFLILDGSSTASQRWEGAPPWYLPVGLSVAFFLSAGGRASLLVFFCSLIAAGVNYHRPLFSWCGIPGAIGIYLGYWAAAELLKKWWPADLERGRLRDIGRYLVACLGGSVMSTGLGVLALLWDGFIHRSELVRTATEWWFSDSLAIVAFTPFLMLYVNPLARHLLSPGGNARLGDIHKRRTSAAEKLEVAAQCALGVFALWLVFAYEPATPYQPLYLFFIPIIWVAVRHGFHGTVLATFAIVAGMMIAAWATKGHQGSLPRLQLAILVLSVTGLFLGAVVTERRCGEQSLRESEKRYRLLFEQNLAGVFRATLSGQILECNPAAAELFGYDSPEEVLNLHMEDLYGATADRKTFLAKLTGNERKANWEIMLRRKAGDAVWAMLNLSLVEHESGKGGVLQGTLVNITERKLAEVRVQSLAYYDSLTALPTELSYAIVYPRRWPQRSEAMRTSEYSSLISITSK